MRSFYGIPQKATNRHHSDRQTAFACQRQNDVEEGRSKRIYGHAFSDGLQLVNGGLLRPRRVGEKRFSVVSDEHFAVGRQKGCDKWQHRDLDGLLGVNDKKQSHIVVKEYMEVGEERGSIGGSEGGETGEELTRRLATDDETRVLAETEVDGPQLRETVLVELLGGRDAGGESAIERGDKEGKLLLRQVAVR